MTGWSEYSSTFLTYSQNCVSKNFITRASMRAGGAITMYQSRWFIPVYIHYVRPSVRPSVRPTKVIDPPTTHSSIWCDGHVRAAFYKDGDVFLRRRALGCEYMLENHSYPQRRHWRFCAIYEIRRFSSRGLWKVSQRRRFGWRVYAYNS